MARVRRFGGFDECREELALLAPHARTPFVAPAWLSAFVGVERGDLAIYVVHEADRPIGYAAMRELRGVLGVREIRFVGHRVSNYLEPVSEPGREAQVWAALLDAWKGDGRPALLDLMDLNDDSPARAALQRVVDGVHVSLPLYACPEAPLSEDWEATFRTLVDSKKKRAEIRKFAARLEALGRVQFEVLRTREAWEARP